MFLINIDGVRCDQSQKQSRWTKFRDFSDLIRSLFMGKWLYGSSMTGNMFCVVMELDLASYSQPGFRWLVGQPRSAVVKLVGACRPKSEDQIPALVAVLRLCGSAFVYLGEGY